MELSYRHQLTHVSSCLNTVNLIDWIYGQRKEHEPFVQGNGHAALAHYVVLEKHGMCDAEEMVNKHGTHAHRDTDHGIWVSNGSLGQAETISTGLAIANPNITIWLVTSDGSCLEGSTSEAFRIAEKYCPNLAIFIVCNGLGAYHSIEESDLPKLPYNATIHHVDQSKYPEWLRGLPGHYLVLNNDQYRELME